MQVLTTTASIVRGVDAGRGQRARAGLGGQRRRMGEKAPVERVGIDREHLVERIEREAARLDAVVALQDRARDQVRAGIETREPVGALEGGQAFGLGVATRRGGGAEAAKNIVATWDAVLRSIANPLFFVPSAAIEPSVSDRHPKKGERRVNPAIGCRCSERILPAGAANPRAPSTGASMKYKFAALTAVLAGMTLLATAPAYADEEEDARARADIRSQIGETDPDYGPAFNWRGMFYPNKKAFIDSGARCSTRHVTDFEQYLHDLSHDTWKAERASMGRSVSARAPGSVNVPVAVHVINKGAGIANGDVPDSQIAAQISVLNAAYACHGLAVLLHARQHRPHHQRDLVHHDAGLAARRRDAKNALRIGGPGTLNLYMANIGQGLLGWATFPQDYAANPKMDGVVILYTSLPGGGAAPYDLGDTATHEIGHWLGLYHTFQGGCTAKNDQVSRHAGREVGGVRLPGRPRHVHAADASPGIDPITNFMDYTDDACMNTFSGGQVSRMDTLHQQYRPTL